MSKKTLLTNKEVKTETWGKRIREINKRLFFIREVIKSTNLKRLIVVFTWKMWFYLNIFTFSISMAALVNDSVTDRSKMVIHSL